MPMEISHIWLGHFPSEEEFDLHFKEIEEEDDYNDMYREVDDDRDEDAADAELYEAEGAGDADGVYADDTGETPINKFAEEQGETFYDDDRVERSFNDNGDLRALIAGHSNATEYLERVISLAESQDLAQVNAFIMADKEEFDAPRSVNGERHRLWYLGEFSCRKETTASVQ